MTGRLTRCSQGHVFQAADLAACPICGEELSPQAPSPSPLPTPLPSPLAAPSLIWSSVAAMAAGGVLFFAFWPMPASRKESAPATQPAQDAVKPSQESATTPPSPKEPAAATPEVVPTLPTSKNSAEAPPADTAGHAQQQQQPSAQPVAPPPAQSSAPASPAQTPAAQPIPAVAPQLPKSPAVAPANTLLPKVDYPGDAVAKLQSALHLSDFLIDMLGEFAAADAMSTAPTPEAVVVLTKLADKGIGVAKFDLANVYFAGPIVGKDDGQGLRYLREAADMGVGPARMKLAQILEEGQLVLQDHRGARELVTLAAREGTGGASTVAQQMGIDVSALGPTGPELTDMALQGNEKAVTIANAFIADHLASGYLALAWYGAKYGKDADLRRNVPDFARKAASLGISNGMNILANLYRDDVLVDKNTTEAYLWITLAHRFCGEPQWCAAEEKLIAKLARSVDMNSVDLLRTAISQTVSPPSDITK